MNENVTRLVQKLNAIPVSRETQGQRDAIVEQIMEFGIWMAGYPAYWTNDAGENLGPVTLPGSVRESSLPEQTSDISAV